MITIISDLVSSKMLAPQSPSGILIPSPVGMLNLTYLNMIADRWDNRIAACYTETCPGRQSFRVPNDSCTGLDVSRSWGSFQRAYRRGSLCGEQLEMSAVMHFQDEPLAPYLSEVIELLNLRPVFGIRL